MVGHVLYQTLAKLNGDYMNYMGCFFFEQYSTDLVNFELFEGSLEVKLPTIWRDEKQSRAEAERRGRLEERRSEEKE